VGIRETLNKNPGLTTGVTAGIILLALVFIIWQAGGGGGVGGGGMAKAFFSNDDGASFFEADATLVPPFQHDGKTAVRAHVYTCDDGATKKVAYLEKFTDKAKEMMEKMRGGDVSDQQFMAMEEIQMTGILVKAPGTGDKGWVPQIHQSAGQIVTPKCPEGSQIRWVMPD
jgi:hypothetical protein